jgi:GT2 family glycosyltransferase
MCEACNRGVRDSRGDIVVFAHDDVEIASPDFAPRLLDALDAADVAGIAGTSRITGAAWAASGPPHIHGQVGYRGDGGRIELVVFGLDAPLRTDAQALDGCFMAARRHVLADVHFDEATFTGWHLYDVDFTVSAWLAGFSVAVCEDLLVIHQSRGQYDERWKRDAQAFAAKHRAALPPPAPITPVAVQGLAVDSIDEWRLVTERLTAKDTPCWVDS